MGAFFCTLGGYLPPPPGAAQPPLRWGSEDHVRGLFAGTGIELDFARETVEFERAGTVDEEVDFATTSFGPLIMARRLLEPQGRWDALLADLRRLLADPKPAEYLVGSGRRS
jgi:hypothetical protein